MDEHEMSDQCKEAFRELKDFKKYFYESFVPCQDKKREDGWMRIDSKLGGVYDVVKSKLPISVFVIVITIFVSITGWMFLTVQNSAKQTDLALTNRQLAETRETQRELVANQSALRSDIAKLNINQERFQVNQEKMLSNLELLLQRTK